MQNHLLCEGFHIYGPYDLFYRILLASPGLWENELIEILKKTAVLKYDLGSEIFE